MMCDATSVWGSEFIRQRLMGPNCLRLLRELAGKIDLSACGRVLDLGCGQGLTSIFLAGITPARIVAFDLWIDAATNQACFDSQGLGDRILAVHGDVNALPFGHRAFDAVVCIDSYHYYGADSRFLDERLAPFVRPGGTIAIVVPGLQRDLTDGVPEEMLPYWYPDMNHYSGRWWAELFGQAKSVRLRERFSLAGHAQAWAEWLTCDNEYARRDVDMMRVEAGKYFDSIGLIATVV